MALSYTGRGHHSDHDSVAHSEDGSIRRVRYHRTRMLDQGTAAVVLAGAGAAAWAITVLVRRAVDRAERIASCEHALWSDPCAGWNATLRCTLCPYQRPDLEAVARYDAERLARRCPHCGGPVE